MLGEEADPTALPPTIEPLALPVDPATLDMLAYTRDVERRIWETFSIPFRPTARPT